MNLKLYNEKEGAYFAEIKIFVLISAVLSAVSTVIFAVLPNTGYANSLSVPAENALWVLTVSPVIAFIGLMLYSLAFFKNFPKGDGMTKALVLSLICFAASVFVFGGALAYTINQWTLGFVAPTYDTPFETVKTVMIIAVCLKVLFGVSIVKTKRI